MLTLNHVHASYHLIHVLWDVCIEVRPGEIVSLIGANGAGKTTLLRVISGLLRPQSGTVTMEGEFIHDKSVEYIVRKKIAHVPEGRRLFGNMTVRENLLLGAYTQQEKETGDLLDFVISLFPVLGERGRQMAGTLSGGEQQMLAIARSLMSRPKLLLLDEPSLGLMPKLVTKLFETISEIRHHATILLVEQNLHLALKVADRGYVLENGRIVLGGQSHDLLRDQYVIEAYLAHGEAQ